MQDLRKQNKSKKMPGAAREKKNTHQTNQRFFRSGRARPVKLQFMQLQTAYIGDAMHRKAPQSLLIEKRVSFSFNFLGPRAPKTEYSNGVIYNDDLSWSLIIHYVFYCKRKHYIVAYIILHLHLRILPLDSHCI